LIMKIGLKLWSTNDHYIEPTRKLFEQKVFDYIELFVVPDSLEYVDLWKNLNIPYTLHAPHSMTELNPALKSCEVRNFELIEQVERYRESLKAEYIIFHPGIEGDVKETVRQFCEIRRKFPEIHQSMLVENKPLIGLNGEKCLGFSPGEIEHITCVCKIGMCLDFGHALAASNSLGIPSEIILEEFNWQEPAMYHLSDGDIKAEIDGHLNLGKGSYPIAKLAKYLPAGAIITLETAKSEKDRLDDFKEDCEYLQKFIRR